MLKTIAIVTLVVRGLAGVEPAYEQHLGYVPVERGATPAELARQWDAPAMAGQAFVLLRPASGEEVYLRLIEAPAGAPPVEPFMTRGWNAAELLVTDTDALAARLADSPFRVIGPPKNLMPGDKAPRAMQVVGPADEVLYLTRIIPGGSGYDLGEAHSPVDRVFITVVGGASMESLRTFWSADMGLAVGEPGAWVIPVLAAAHGLPADTRFPLSVAAMPKDYLVELDQYPATARDRPRAEGALPRGIAMVSFTAERLDDLHLAWRRPPAPVSAPPYAGRRAATTIGSAGEWIEVIETPPAGVSAPGPQARPGAGAGTAP